MNWPSVGLLLEPNMTNDDSAGRGVNDSGTRALALLTAGVHNDWVAIDRLLTGAVQVDAKGTMLALLGLLLGMVEVGAQASGSDAETFLRTVRPGLIAEVRKWVEPLAEPSARWLDAQP
jgi:hypothetical protein